MALPGHPLLKRALVAWLIGILIIAADLALIQSSTMTDIRVVRVLMAPALMAFVLGGGAHDDSGWSVLLLGSVFYAVLVFAVLSLATHLRHSSSNN